MAFTKDTFAFLAELEANNSKDWFDANRDRYEAHWKGAALDFTADIAPDMARLDPALQAVPKLNKTLRRINRDVRFSKDKSPYNARLHMIFWTGVHPNRSPAMHVVLQPDGIGYGAGQFGLEPAALAHHRRRILGKDGKALIAALDQASGVGCRMGDPELARLPKGFEAEGRAGELLRHKAYVVRTHDNLAPKSKIIGGGAKSWVMEVTAALLPLIRWLKVD
ncbi:MAG: DUF2461 domain-containing protein [Silicimonas sp.]|nr:DUF2461 domain-containing protein [Silicimonas sp.]